MGHLLNQDMAVAIIAADGLNGVFDMSGKQMDWQELIDRACMTIPAEKEEKMFEEAVGKGEISEAVLIMNPKHKEQLGEFLNVSGLKIPIIWHRYVEEDKVYIIWGK